MITAIGIGLLGGGAVLIYAGVTGQSLRDELIAAFTGGPSPSRQTAAPRMVDAPIVVLPAGSSQLPSGVRPNIIPNITSPVLDPNIGPAGVPWTAEHPYPGTQ